MMSLIRTTHRFISMGTKTGTSTMITPQIKNIVGQSSQLSEFSNLNKYRKLREIYINSLPYMIKDVKNMAQLIVKGGLKQQRIDGGNNNINSNQSNYLKSNNIHLHYEVSFIGHQILNYAILINGLAICQNNVDSVRSDENKLGLKELILKEDNQHQEVGKDINTKLQSYSVPNTQSQNIIRLFRTLKYEIRQIFGYITNHKQLKDRMHLIRSPLAALHMVQALATLPIQFFDGDQQDLLDWVGQQVGLLLEAEKILKGRAEVLGGQGSIQNNGSQNQQFDQISQNNKIILNYDKSRIIVDKLLDQDDKRKYKNSSYHYRPLISNTLKNMRRRIQYYWQVALLSKAIGPIKMPTQSNIRKKVTKIINNNPYSKTNIRLLSYPQLKDLNNSFKINSINLFIRQFANKCRNYDIVVIDGDMYAPMEERIRKIYMDEGGGKKIYWQGKEYGGKEMGEGAMMEASQGSEGTKGSPQKQNIDSEGSMPIQTNSKISRRIVKLNGMADEKQESCKYQHSNQQIDNSNGSNKSIMKLMQPHLGLPYYSAIRDNSNSLSRNFIENSNSNNIKNSNNMNCNRNQTVTNNLSNNETFKRYKSFSQQLILSQLALTQSYLAAVSVSSQQSQSTQKNGSNITPPTKQTAHHLAGQKIIQQYNSYVKLWDKINSLNQQLKLFQSQTILLLLSLEDCQLVQWAMLRYSVK